MADKLKTYRGKRDLKRSPEPSGDGKPARKRARRKPREPRFVVQEHSATRLHWDLRLEHDGTLASWAVPNGIPDDPGENRMAVRTEDHPLEYLDFEGEIPEGTYGAGTMKIHDRGTYSLEKWEDRKVMVDFHGERVRGRYALFQTGTGKDWMIHRIDPPADPDREPLPERLVPMMARLASHLPPVDERWAYEVKWDGVRAIAYSEPGRLHLESRNLIDITDRYPEVRRINRALGAHSAVLDGEIVAFDREGRPSFERLQGRMHLTGDSAVRRKAREVPVVYVIFDLLYLDGRSLMDRPYAERRGALDGLELEGEAWRVPPFRTGGGAAFREASREQGLEGIVAKKLECPYQPGRRVGHWLKVKNLTRQEVVIGGWVPGEGRRAERIGALVVGVHDPDGGGLRYAGKVGTGFDERELERLSKLLVPLRRKTNPFTGRRPPKGTIYVEPRLVAEVEFREWTSQGMLRAPSYKGLRRDKDPDDVVAEKEATGGGEAESGPGPTLDELLDGARRLPSGGAEVEVQGHALKLSNLDKVLYPKAGFTKGDVIDYYARISPVLLPHLAGRPLTLKRYPNGVEAEHFYEKQCPKHRPDWVATAAIWSRHNEREIEYCLAADLPTLVWLGNLADLELHTSLALAEDVDRPTVLAFDLDPGAPADILDCCEVGLWLRGMFEQLGLESYPKTSGSKGLQVYVPLNVRTTYDETKPFAKAVAETLEQRAPDRVVSRMTKSLRKGKVLVDWSQNDEHKTTVNVYSLRAREQPTVSTPVTWEEVQRASASRDAELLAFTSDEVLRRVDRHGDLFAPVLSAKQRLPAL